MTPAPTPPTGTDDPLLAAVAVRFAGGQKITSIEPFGSGHINDTFLVTAVNRQPFILQRINHHVFPCVEALMANFEAVSQHLLHRSPAMGYHSVQLIKTPEGATFTGDEAQGYWRAMHLIEGSVTYNKVADPVLVGEAGRALGAFHVMFDGFPIEMLYPTIPFFHHAGRRLTQFTAAVKQASAGRMKNAGDLIELTHENTPTLLGIDRLTDTGAVPLRVVHNDPKLNNILFDENRKALCLIDLDTVMPGCLLHDFGDAIRTTASMANEDEPDDSLCGINLALFDTYTRGYAETTRSMLTNKEIEHLALSAFVMTFTIGLRFLTDYLSADVYYKTAYPGHNLVRARSQYAQAADILRKLPEMKQIVKQYF